MKEYIARGIVAALLVLAFAAGLVAFVTPAVAQSCETKCYRDYRACVPFCSKNPCFVSCETVLEICLSNCGATE